MKWRYFKHKIWKVRTDKLSKAKAFWVRFLRILLLTIQGFSKRQIQQGASALTYYSLLGVVPLIALAMGISRGFLLEEALESWLLEKFAEEKEVVTKVIEFAHAALEQAGQGLFAAISFTIFFWAAIKIFRNIEVVLNSFWEVKRARTVARQFSDYLALLLICPLIIIITSSLTFYLTTQMKAVGKGGEFFKEIGPFLFPILHLSPYLLTALLFTFVYIFLPNTRVRFRPALYAGLLAGVFYQLFQWGYLTFQIGVTRYNTVYGTFAALPLFLIWVHLSWVILLLGAKISFAFQNVNAYEFITEEFRLSHTCKTILSLRIAHLCIKNFCKGSSPLSVTDISNRLSIPLLLTNELIYHLVDEKVLSELRTEIDKESAFQPAQSVDQLTIKHILDMMDERGETIPLPHSKELSTILENLKEFSRLIERSNANILLKDI